MNLNLRELVGTGITGLEIACTYVVQQSCPLRFLQVEAGTRIKTRFNYFCRPDLLQSRYTSEGFQPRNCKLYLSGVLATIYAV